MSRELTMHQAGINQPKLSPAVMLRRAIGHFGGGSKWIKGDFHDGDGSCALGAIELAFEGACMDTEQYHMTQAALLQTLKEMHPALQAETIPDLNDDPSVTYESIVAAFEKTALMFEEKVSE